VARSGDAAPAPAEPRVLRVTKSGFDGTVPGPELRVKRSEEFAVRVINELDEPTAVHWHGVRLPNAMDGAPPLTQAPIAPGASFDYRFVAPDAGTFWYHPPPPAAPALHGALIVEEASPVDADQDVTLIFAAAKDGDFFTVNGKDMQVCNVSANQRLRLRLINASLDRIFRLHLVEQRCFVMAIDGEPAQPFVAQGGELTLGPGNRIDVFADCPLLRPGDVSLVTIQNTDRTNAPIVKIVGSADVPTRATLRPDPSPLPSNPLPERMAFGDAFRFDAAIGRLDKRAAPLFTVKRGRTVVLGLSNSPSGLLNSKSGNAYIHLHGHSFRLLDALDDGWKPFWLDTMPMAPGGKSRVAFVADNPGKWLIEGLAAPNGASTWFEVT
jgi:FtsP/CotA-like multicopper oxidase with cupredoxin domain